MKDSVDVWIKNCDVCQRTKPEIKRQIAPMGQFAASGPPEQVAVDVMGPFKEIYCKSTNFGVLLYLANLANCVSSLIFVAANIYVNRTLHRRATGRRQI